MTIKEYLANLNIHFKRGISNEHTYRTDLQTLIESLVPDIKATNEPRRKECGAPYSVLTHNDVPVGYIEAKDIDKNLKDKLYREQFGQYRNALDNLIITDYLIFEFYKEGEFVASVQIGEIRNNEIVAITDNLDTFTQLIQDFCRFQGQTIRSPKRLAELMATKARLLANSIHGAIEKEEKEENPSELSSQFDAFCRVLYEWAKADIKNNIEVCTPPIISYKPFDNKYLYYTGNARGIVGWPVKKIMRHFIQGDNVVLVTARSNKSETCYHFYITKYITETKLGERTTQSATFPLYPDPDKPDAFSDGKRKPNLDEAIVAKISKKLKLTFVNEENEEVVLPKGYEGTFAPIHLLDYIYAILHSPTYRDTYKEFLKTDFPCIPYPSDRDKFWQLVALGKQIRELHLLERKGTAGVTYPCEGTNIVARSLSQQDFEITNIDLQTGRVWINDTQYFDNVLLLAWWFYIGGYQPAQKWLKDRRNRELLFDDIEHYQNIIHALCQTDSLMNQIEQIIVI